MARTLSFRARSLRYKTVAEYHLSVVAAPDVGLDGEIGQAVGGVEAHELKQGVELHAPARQGLELRHVVLVVGVEQQLSLACRRCIANDHAHGAVRGPHRDLLQQWAEHLDSAAAAREGQEGQAGFGAQHPVDADGVVQENPVGAPLDREPGRRRIGAHQRCLEPEVARDLLRGRHGAAAGEGPRGRRRAHQELGDIRRGGIQGAVRAHGNVLLETDVAGGEGGQQRAVLGAAGGGGDRLAALCSSGVSRKAVAVRLLTVRSAVGSTPGLFSRSVTRWPRLLKFAMRGAGVRLADWPLDQQSQLIWRVLPLPRMG